MLKGENVGPQKNNLSDQGSHSGSDQSDEEEEMEKKGAQKEMKEEREGKMPNPYRLSHFVAPLYVAPSPTPGNAKPTSE